MYAYDKNETSETRLNFAKQTVFIQVISALIIISKISEIVGRTDFLRNNQHFS